MMLNLFKRPANLKTLVITCPQLDDGKRKQAFRLEKFPSAEFIEGIPHKNLPDNELVKTILGRKIHFGMDAKDFDKPALAVALSHKLAWERVLELNTACLILEDDVVKVNTNLLKLDYLVNRPNYPERSILTLWRQGVSDYLSFNHHYEQLQCSFGNSGALAYIIEPHMAKEMIEKFHLIENPVDHYLLRSGVRGETENYIVLCSKIKLVEMNDNGMSLRDKYL